MKLLLAIVVLIAIAGGGMAALAHHDVVSRCNREFKHFQPVTASFSRFRGDRHHIISVYYRLRFPAKKPHLREVFAFWSLHPFRQVTVVTK